MIEAHTGAIEEVLLAQSLAARNAGHPNLKGGPREWFIRDFLEGHLPGTLEVGQGEIIDADSRPQPPQDEYRPQVDVVVYRQDMPKIRYSRTDFAYLAEGVMATIEVKSHLTEVELAGACEAARIHHSLRRSYHNNAAWRMRSYVVGYDGPAQVQTVAGWMPRIAQDKGWPVGGMVDLIVFLGRGVIWKIDAFPEMNVRKMSPEHEWAYIDQARGNLYILFTHMLT